jgi:hypothetical protein
LVLKDNAFKIDTLDDNNKKYNYSKLMYLLTNKEWYKNIMNNTPSTIDMNLQKKNDIIDFIQLIENFHIKTNKDYSFTEYELIIYIIINHLL